MLFAPYRIIAIYAGAEPVLMYGPSGSHVTNHGQSAVILLGGAQGARVAAIDELMPSQPGHPPEDTGWHIPFAPSQRPVKAEPLTALSPALRQRIELWLPGVAPSTQSNPRSLACWTFPAGTLVAADYLGQYAVGFFPISGRVQPLITLREPSPSRN